MLCRKFRHIISSKTPSSHHVAYSLIPSRLFSKTCMDFINAAKFDGVNMSSSLRLRHILKDFVVARLYSAFTRSYLLSSVVRRCRKDRGVREVIQCFRHAILKPRRTLLLAVTAAYKNNDEKSGPPPPCEQNITDDDLQALVTELEGIDEISRATLYCPGCTQRVTLDKNKAGVRYCACKDAPPPQSDFDGWVPFMEAEDVIIWHKEYKPGGLYAYKVYGRYKDVRAEDFAAVQVDGAYRRLWDTAVAALSVVERQANGVRDQAVLHWEVLWPRLFANRDYVYMRRHKEFSVKTRCMLHKDGIFDENPCETAAETDERPSVHSNAKRKAKEMDKMSAGTAQGGTTDDKVYVIVSRSCVHPQVPATRNAIRVTEYWSHMVVKSLNGPENVGMEFVLTYYDEPAVGGMPSGVTSWATGRAAPAFLDRMHKATRDYRDWRARNDQEAPDFTPFGPEKVSFGDKKATVAVSEQDMESSKLGPDIENGEKRDEAQAAASRAGAGPVGVEDVHTKDKDKGDGTSPKDRVSLVIVCETPVRVDKVDVASTQDQVTVYVSVTEPSETFDKVQLATKMGQVYPVSSSELTTDHEKVQDADNKIDSSGKTSVEPCQNITTQDMKTSPGDAKTTREDILKNFDNREGNSEKIEEKSETEEKDGVYWRNMYPFYYFL